MPKKANGEVMICCSRCAYVKMANGKVEVKSGKVVGQKTQESVTVIDLEAQKFSKCINQR